MVRVSIPQSEFCPLGLGDNSNDPTPGTKFQFLSRNSVRWDPNGDLAPEGGSGKLKVSIPQSEFCPLGPPLPRTAPSQTPPVSIPQSEFCPLGRNC